MSKRLSTYGGYTATQIKARSSFPDLADITTGATYIDCDNLKTNDLESVLSESTNKKSLLNKSSNINQYSHFKAGWWALDSGSLVFNQDTAGYKIGDMAGYNHSAPAPSKSGHNTTANVIYGGSNVTVNAIINIGEIDWRGTFLANIDAVEMVVKQGATILERQEITYTDTTQQSGFSFSKSVYMSGAGTLTAYFYFNEDGSNVAPIPNISTHNISVSVIYPAAFGTVELDATLQASFPSWVLIYDESLSEIDQSADTYTLYTLCIDSDSDDEGDISRFDMDLFCQKSTMKSTEWYEVATGLDLSPGYSGVTITDDDLPWSVGNGDIINFELRDSV